MREINWKGKLEDFEELELINNDSEDIKYDGDDTLTIIAPGVKLTLHPGDMICVDVNGGITIKEAEVKVIEEVKEPDDNCGYIPLDYLKKLR